MSQANEGPPATVAQPEQPSAERARDPVTPRLEPSSAKAQTSGFPHVVWRRSRAIPSNEDFLAFPLQDLGRRGGRRLGPGVGEGPGAETPGSSRS